MSVQALASVTQICCCLWEERDRRANQRLDLRWSDNRYTGFLIGEVKATGVLVSYVDYNIRPQASGSVPPVFSCDSYADFHFSQLLSALLYPSGINKYARDQNIVMSS